MTNSLWHALTGEPVSGRLAPSGIKLRTLPVVVSAWGQWQRSQLLPTKAFIDALLNNTPKAYSLTLPAQERLTHDTLGGVALVLVRAASGRTVRAYQRAGQHCTPSPDAQMLLDKTSHPWVVTEETLEKTGTPDRLPRVPGHLAYWFGWFAFHP